MKTTKVYKTNKDGKTISKEVENNLVGIYTAMGWTLKEKKVIPVQPKRTTFTKRNVEEDVHD